MKIKIITDHHRRWKELWKRINNMDTIFKAFVKAAWGSYFERKGFRHTQKEKRDYCANLAENTIYSAEEILNYVGTMHAPPNGFKDIEDDVKGGKQ